MIYYGDEIGMGDNIHLGDRDGVRTPMQWSPDRNGGFSRANPASLVLPAIMDPLYGFDAVNVESAGHRSAFDAELDAPDARDPLAASARSVAARCASCTPVNRKVLAYLREHSSADGQIETILCVANVSRSAQPVELELSEFSGRVPVEMIGGSMFPAIGSLPYLLDVAAVRLLLVHARGRGAAAGVARAAPEALPDFRTLVVRKDIDELIEGDAKKTLETDILPGYLQKRRWFGQKDGKLDLGASSRSRSSCRATAVRSAWCEIETKAAPLRRGRTLSAAVRLLRRGRARCPRCRSSSRSRACGAAARSAS